MSNENSNQSTASVVQGTHGKWSVRVDGKRVSRFFDTRAAAVAFGVPAAFRSR